MKAKAYFLAAALLLALANGVTGTPFISSVWLAGEAQTPNDTPHYYQTGSFSVSSGAHVNFKVTATGTYPLSYQWQLNGTNLPNATCSATTTCTYGYPGTALNPQLSSYTETGPRQSGTGM